jgi:DNA-directed RNA polymerase specialized sigma24 family protein
MRGKENLDGMAREAREYLKGYQINRKLLRLDRYERDYLSGDDSDTESYGEAPLARARMFEIRHFVMKLRNSDEKLLLYYHYIKGQPIEKCAELLGISRSTAFRMRKRALKMAAERLSERSEKKAE